MKLLLNNNIIFAMGTIEKGIYPADPSRELYKITNGEEVMYAVTEGFNFIEIDSIPEEVCIEKWCYTEDEGFYENPDYQEYVAESDKIAQLEEKVSQLEGKNAELITQSEELNNTISLLIDDIIPTLFTLNGVE